jgi:hypothetical protein
VRGRTATEAGEPVSGVDVAFRKGDYREDITSGPDGWFTIGLAESGVYSFSGVGIVCASTNWFSGGQCNGYNLFVDLDTSGSVTVPATEPVSLVYERVTIVLQGTAWAGATQVQGRSSTGASAWNNNVSSSGAFQLGVTAGTWTFSAVRHSPSYSSGPSVTITVSEGSDPAPLVLPGPP